MSLVIRQSEFFITDFELQYRWYESKGGEEIARRYLVAVDQTLQQLAELPELGRVRLFRHPDLQSLRSFQVRIPFQKHLVFYRQNEGWLDAVRIMHGARDLAHRLAQIPGGNDP